MCRRCLDKQVVMERIAWLCVCLTLAAGVHAPGSTELDWRHPAELRVRPRGHKRTNFRRRWVSTPDILQDRHFRDRSNRPILYLFSSSTCQACIKLKQSLASSSEFASLSRHFLLVLIERQEDAQGVSALQLY